MTDTFLMFYLIASAFFSVSFGLFFIWALQR